MKLYFASSVCALVLTEFFLAAASPIPFSRLVSRSESLNPDINENLSPISPLVARSGREHGAMAPPPGLSTESTYVPKAFLPPNTNPPLMVPKKEYPEALNSLFNIVGLVRTAVTKDPENKTWDRWIKNLKDRYDFGGMKFPNGGSSHPILAGAKLVERKQMIRDVVRDHNQGKWYKPDNHIEDEIRKVHELGDWDAVKKENAMAVRSAVAPVQEQKLPSAPNFYSTIQGAPAILLPHPITYIPVHPPGAEMYQFGGIHPGAAPSPDPIRYCQAASYPGNILTDPQPLSPDRPQSRAPALAQSMGDGEGTLPPDLWMDYKVSIPKAFLPDTSALILKIPNKNYPQGLNSIVNIAGLMRTAVEKETSPAKKTPFEQLSSWKCKLRNKKVLGDLAFASGSVSPSSMKFLEGDNLIERKELIRDTVIAHNGGKWYMPTRAIEDEIRGVHRDWKAVKTANAEIIKGASQKAPSLQPESSSGLKSSMQGSTTMSPCYPTLRLGYEHKAWVSNPKPQKRTVMDIRESAGIPASHGGNDFTGVAPQSNAHNLWQPLPIPQTPPVTNLVTNTDSHIDPFTGISLLHTGSSGMGTGVAPYIQTHPYNVSPVGTSRNSAPGFIPPHLNSDFMGIGPQSDVRNHWQRPQVPQNGYQFTHGVSSSMDFGHTSTFSEGHPNTGFPPLGASSGHAPVFPLPPSPHLDTGSLTSFYPYQIYHEEGEEEEEQRQRSKRQRYHQ